MTRHIAHLTSSHVSPDPRIFFRECQTAAAAGYRVTLVAPESALPYPDSSVEILSVPVHANRFLRMTLSVLGVARHAFKLKADVYHLHCPELIPTGLLLKLRGAAVVYDSHEDLPDQVAEKAWVPDRIKPAVQMFARALVGSANRFFDGIVAATPTIADDYTPQKTIVMRNLPRVASFPNVATNLDLTTGPVVFPGGMKDVSGIRELVDAMEIAGPATGRRLALVGTITPSSFLEELKTRPGWEWVDFQGYVRSDDIPAILAEAAIGMVAIHGTPNHVRSEPNKLFEYMLAGLPIIASNFEYWQQFVTEPGTGLQVDPAEPAAIAEAIVYLAENPEIAREMGARGRALAEREYTWESQEHILLGLYERILTSRGHAADS